MVLVAAVVVVGLSPVPLLVLVDVVASILAMDARVAAMASLALAAEAIAASSVSAGSRVLGNGLRSEGGNGSLDDSGFVLWTDLGAD